MELRNIIDYKKGKAPSNHLLSNEMVIYLSPEYLRNKSKETLIPNFLGKVEVKNGDLLLLWDGSNAGEFFLGKDGVLSSTMVKLLFDENENDRLFLYYQLKFIEDYLKSQTNGSGIPHVDKEILFSIDVQHFEPQEQTQIASILSKVDEAIQQTEQLIAKYTRIKTGLMQDLLTKGIDEKGNIRSEATHEFKDSPLGRIPKEWEYPELESVKIFITSGSRGWAKYYSTEGSQFIRITNLKRNQIDIDRTELKYVKLPKAIEGMRSKLELGDLLISITADLGIIGVVPTDFGDAFVNQHIALVRLDQKEVNPQFIGYFLCSQLGQAMFSLLNDGGAKAGLNLKTINKLLFLKPKKSEQDLIVNKIEKVNKSVFELKAQLSKLQSLKTGLMQDLLSGKVRVNHLIKKAETV